MLVLSSCRPSTFRKNSPPPLSLSISSEERKNHTFLPQSSLVAREEGCGEAEVEGASVMWWEQFCYLTLAECGWLQAAF